MNKRDPNDASQLAEILASLGTAVLLQLDVSTGAIVRVESSLGESVTQQDLSRLRAEIVDEFPYVFESWDDYSVGTSDSSNAGSFVVSMEAARMVGFARSSDSGTVWAAQIADSTDIDEFIMLLRSLVERSA